MQLTAQALCLEEMLCCEIPKGYLFYGETRHRHEVIFTEELRERTEKAIVEMRMYYDRRYTPKVKRSKSCNACSLKDICLPVLCGGRSASEYVKEMLGEDTDI
jgi:CRISPR-associated exonuclease Cas4